MSHTHILKAYYVVTFIAKLFHGNISCKGLSVSESLFQRPFEELF